MQRDNPIHSFFQVMTGQIHDQLALGSLRWFTVGMAWVMFFGGIAIAARIWLKYPEQRTAHHACVFAAASAGQSLGLDFLLRKESVFAAGSTPARLHALAS